MNSFSYHASLLSYDYLLDKAPTSQERKGEYYLHMHNDYEILFFFDGDADYIVENKVYPLKKNSLLFIKPMAHHGLHVLSAKPYERAVINFSKQILTDEQKRFVDGLSSYYYTPENSPVYNVFTALRDLEDRFGDDEFDYLKKSSLYNVLSMLKYSESGQSSGTSGNDVLGKIVAFINENAAMKLDTQSLAKRFFVSKSWIDHAFKTTMKTSPKRYINQKKILYAQSKILDGCSLKDVVEACNYENYSTFYRQYLMYLHHEPAFDKQLYVESQKK